MIPYRHQFIDKNDIAQVMRVFKSDWLTQGPKVLEFEKTLALLASVIIKICKDWVIKMFCL